MMTTVTRVRDWLTNRHEVDDPQKRIEYDKERDHRTDDYVAHEDV